MYKSANSATSISRFEPTHHQPGRKCEAVWSSQIPQHVTVAAESQLHVLHSKGDLRKAILTTDWKAKHTKETQKKNGSHRDHTKNHKHVRCLDLVLPHQQWILFWGLIQFLQLLHFNAKSFKIGRIWKNWKNDILIYFKKNRINDHGISRVTMSNWIKVRSGSLRPGPLVRPWLLLAWVSTSDHALSQSSHGMSFECGLRLDQLKTHFREQPAGTSISLSCHVLSWCSFCSTLCY